MRTFSDGDKVCKYSSRYSKPSVTFVNFTGKKQYLSHFTEMYKRFFETSSKYVLSDQFESLRNDLTQKRDNIDVFFNGK